MLFHIKKHEIAMSKWSGAITKVTTVRKGFLKDDKKLAI